MMTGLTTRISNASRAMQHLLTVLFKATVQTSFFKIFKWTSFFVGLKYIFYWIFPRVKDCPMTLIDMPSAMQDVLHFVLDGQSVELENL